MAVSPCIHNLFASTMPVVFLLFLSVLIVDPAHSPQKMTYARRALVYEVHYPVGS
jgi:hypothetical protein